MQHGRHEAAGYLDSLFPVKVEWRIKRQPEDYDSGTEAILNKAGETVKTVDAQNPGVKFTVIICTYNYAHLLPDALRTLAAQTYRDFELLIVDDGSTDHSHEVVQQFSPKFQNCVYFRKDHSGLADTRNVAIQKATGTHLAFLDADDLWSPNYLEAVFEKVRTNPQVELVVCNGVRILDDGRVLGDVFRPNIPPPDSAQSSPGQLFFLCNDFLPTGMVFRKSLYERIGGFDTRFNKGLGDDTDWVIRAVLAGARCARIDQRLFLYRFHGRNLTSNPLLIVDPWLTIFDEKVRGSHLGREFEQNARNFTRHYVLRLLPVCSTSGARSLLSRTLETLHGDYMLRCAYFSTYFGLIQGLKVLKRVKNLVQRILPARRVDLTAPPEAIFESV